MSSSRDARTGAATTHSATSDDGVEIAFDLYGSPSRFGVLIVPGFWRTRRYPILRAIGSRIASGLTSCAVMDIRGHGDSGGVFEFNRYEHQDVAAVVRELREVAGVERIGLLAFSAGGAIAVSMAARHPELPLAGIVLVSSVGDFRRVVPRPNPFTIHRHLSFGEAVKPPRFRWPRDGRHLALEDVRLVTAPICLIHTRNDWLVSHRHSEQLRSGAPNAELHILDIPGRYHADKLFDVAPELVWPIIDEFFLRFSQP